MRLLSVIGDAYHSRPILATAFTVLGLVSFCFLLHSVLPTISVVMLTAYVTLSVLSLAAVAFLSQLVAFNASNDELPRHDGSKAKPFQAPVYLHTEINLPGIVCRRDKREITDPTEKAECLSKYPYIEELDENHKTISVTIYRCWRM